MQFCNIFSFLAPNLKVQNKGELCLMWIVSKPIENTSKSISEWKNASWTIYSTRLSIKNIFQKLIPTYRIGVWMLFGHVTPNQFIFKTGLIIIKCIYIQSDKQKRNTGLQYCFHLPSQCFFYDTVGKDMSLALAMHNHNSDIYPFLPLLFCWDWLVGSTSSISFLLYRFYYHPNLYDFLTACTLVTKMLQSPSPNKQLQFKTLLAVLSLQLSAIPANDGNLRVTFSTVW